MSDNDLVRCAQCKAVVSATDAVIDAVRVGQEALIKATTLQNKGKRHSSHYNQYLTNSADPAKSMQLSENMIPILKSVGLTPGSHPLLGLTRLHQSLILDNFPDPDKLTQEILDEAVRTIANSVRGLTEILTPGHPVRGIALAELGKILAVDEPSPKDNTTAVANMTFPPSGPTRLKMAYDTLLNARQELMIGFGTMNDGGKVGKEVRDVLVGLEKELSVWRERSGDALKDARAANANANSK